MTRSGVCGQTRSAASPPTWIEWTAWTACSRSGVIAPPSEDHLELHPDGVGADLEASPLDAAVVELDPTISISDLPIILQDVHHFSSDGVASVVRGDKGGVGQVDVHVLRIAAFRDGPVT